MAPLPSRLASCPQEWLATTGSPRSVIERCDFSDERHLDALQYAEFAVRRR